MCYHFQTPNMLTWLRSQVRILEAWREDIAMHPELDFEMITRLERHYQWLTTEISHLETLRGHPTLAARLSSLKAV